MRKEESTDDKLPDRVLEVPGRLPTLRRVLPAFPYVRQPPLRVPHSFSVDWELCFVRFLEEPAAAFRVLTVAFSLCRAGYSARLARRSYTRDSCAHLLSWELLFHLASPDP